MRAAVGRSYKPPARRHSLALNISRRSLRRILHSVLHFHTHKDTLCKNCQTVFLLHEVHFVSNFVTLVNEHPDIRHLIIIDEAHSELFGCVNRQNLLSWSEANPNGLIVKPLHSQIITL